MKRLEVRLPIYLYELLRKDSFDSDRSMTEIVTDLLVKKYIGEEYRVIKEKGVEK